MKVPLFESGDVYFCRHTSEWLKMFEHLKLSDSISSDTVGRSTVLVSKNGHCIYLIGVFNGSMATLAHEAAHIAFCICRHVGVEVNQEKSNETFCYLLTRLVEFGERYMKKPV